MTLKRSPYKSSLLIYGGQAKPLKQSKVKEERLRVIRDNLQLLRQQYYYATWKADGTRYMIILVYCPKEITSHKFLRKNENHITQVKQGKQHGL
ncbi:hypothetical protein G4B88_030174 [Cannabis sativa]|uniref:mRNA capping enzyme adenylation domain-containing protein n=1 Tax=Cannabis sativa TaxID=3483 RepID=A0A7J6E793_CANSA|nr:hypothetical protein G4B88_030174 [Cannabis sativa]